MPALEKTSTPWLRQTDHYENFPVGSVLIPSRLRPPMAAIYRFARYGDDVADEGDAPAAERLAELGRLKSAILGQGSHPIVTQLDPTIVAHSIDRSLFVALLEAFEQDARGTNFKTFADVRDYCRHSADPVGRIVLKLFKADKADALTASDNVCTALQLINFAQDLGQDTARGRCYVPLEDLQAFGLTQGDLEQCVADSHASPAVIRLLEHQIDRALKIMASGTPLLDMVGGRLRLELIAIVAAGHTMLAKVRRHDPFARRLKLGKSDLPAILRTSTTLFFGMPLR